MATKQSSPRKNTAAPRLPPLRNVVPDRVDLRDRPYMPSIRMIPVEQLVPKPGIPVLNQKTTLACTGFALASVIYHLQRQAKRNPSDYVVSPFMLYSMARRYDEFPGDPTADTGSSLRGAMKGWYKHGVCAVDLWKTPDMPVLAPNHRGRDWWLDAVKRPLGAYYRVDTRSVTDMQIALNEIGALYASAVCHAGWNNVTSRTKSGIVRIEQQAVTPADGGHAFAIVGYTREGFVIHNSWDTTWGTDGRAILTYDDWLENAMDCWVAQLGVTTDLHTEIAAATSLRVKDGKVQLASDKTLRNREISPFVIDMENNGRLSNTGDFRTQPSDVEALVTQHLSEAIAKWNLPKGQPIDIAIYAHGGLTSEDGAAATASSWIPALYNAKIFPIFLMWETDLWSTLKDRAEDLLQGTGATGGVLDRMADWWNRRLERLLAVPGTAVWGEMKQNADAISGDASSGGITLYQACAKSPHFADPTKVRLHLIGHSAGAIVHTHVVDRLGKLGWNFDSVNFMAPAVRSDLFESLVLPRIKNGSVRRFHEFHLTDGVEQKDPTCKPILGYSRSLLYLVSQSFEKGEVTPILGMQKYFDSEIGSLKLPNITVVPAPGADSRATTHGGFDDDEATMNKVISLIRSA